MTQANVVANTPRGGEILPGGLREVAKHLGVGERTAYRMARRGEYPFSTLCIRIGWTYVIPRRSWERFLAGELRPEYKSAAPVFESR